MESLAIRQYPDSILRRKCSQIEKITPKEITVFELMLSTMYKFEGVGLAAPQIGITSSLLVVDIGDGAIKLANPVILKVRGSDRMEEGCLSIPSVTVDIERPYEIVAGGLNEEGRVVEIKAQGLLARVLQHEIDHLKGRLIVDYLNLLEKFKRRLHKRKQVERYANL